MCFYLWFHHKSGTHVLLYPFINFIIPLFSFSWSSILYDCWKAVKPLFVWVDSLLKQVTYSLLLFSTCIFSFCKFTSFLLSNSNSIFVYIVSFCYIVSCNTNKFCLFYFKKNWLFKFFTWIYTFSPFVCLRFKIIPLYMYVRARKHKLSGFTSKCLICMILIGFQVLGMKISSGFTTFHSHWLNFM